MSEKDTETKEVSTENPTEESQEETSQNPEDRLAEIEATNKQLYERARKAEEAAKEAKRQLDELSANNSYSSYQAEPDDVAKRVAELEREISTTKAQAELDRAIASNPALKEHIDEFKEYKESRNGYATDDVVRLFLAEKGLSETQPKRKGLEKPSTQSETPKTPGTMTSKEAADLRNNNFRMYQKMLQNGTLKIKD